MGKVEFVARLVEALAWPGTVILIFLVLRKPLRELVPLLHRLRYRNLELDFAQQVQDAERQSDRVLPAPDVGAPKSVVRMLADRLAAGQSRSVVVNTWRQVSEAVFALAARKEVRVEGELILSVAAVLAALEKKGVLAPEMASIIYQLAAMRNTVAHAAPSAVDDATVRDYAYMGARIVVHLNGL